MGAARAVTAVRLSVRAARGLSGLLAGGLVVLAIVVCVAQWLAGTSGRPGPGMSAVVGHVIGASVAVVLQRVADRSRGPRAALACGSVLAIAVVVLWLGWWS